MALVTAILLGTAAPAAAEWWLIGANVRSVMFVDRASLVRTGDLVTQRVSVVTPNSPIRRVEVVERLDCKAGTATDLKRTYHLSNGTTIGQATDGKPRHPKPETVGWASLQFACGTDESRNALGAPIGSVPLDEVAQFTLNAGRL